MADEAPARLVAQHIEQGLARYGRGELLAALAEWEHALRIDPINLRARQYVQYVRENFELLASQFGRMVEGSAAPPLPELPEEAGADAGGPSSSPFGGPSQTEALAALAPGWELEDFMPEELPPPPTAPPVPEGIEVPPAADWARPRQRSADELAAVAQAVLEPFGISMTPPRGTEALEPGGSMEALGGRPMEAEPLEGLEPGLDLERTKPSRVPKTRVPGLPTVAEPLDPEEIAAFEAATGDIPLVPPAEAAPPTEPAIDFARWAAPADTLPPAAARRGALEPPPSDPEVDFSGLLDEEEEVTVRARPPILPDIKSGPGRTVSYTASGEIVVELVAELPEESEGPGAPVEIAEDYAPSQVDLEAPTQERGQLPEVPPPEQVGPPVDDSLLGLEPEGPPAPPAPAESEPAAPPAELEIVMQGSPPEPGSVQEVVESDLSPPPHEPPVITLAPPSGSGAWRVVEAEPAEPAELAELEKAALLDWEMKPPEARPEASLEQRPTRRAPARPTLPSQFADESTPLPAPYDPDAVDDDIIPLKSTKPAGGGRPLDPEQAGTTVERVQAHLAEARKQFERGDLAAAAAAAEAAFACDPGGEAAPLREASRQLLIRIFETRLGSLRRVPEVCMGAAEIARLGLDHRFGFLLDRIDGETTLDDLLDIAGMPRLEAFRILESLLRRGVIGFRS